MELLVKPEMLTLYIYIYIYITLAFLALLGAPYIYDISSLRVKVRSRLKIKLHHFVFHAM